jgi:hypothetical protein
MGGNDKDSFDFKYGQGGAGTVRGGENSNFVLGGPTSRLSGDTHSVRRGDTLWGICDMYFRNPYQWPRIWSYNAQIQNPHWIYPGDQVRLRPQTGLPTEDQPKGPGMSIVDRRRQVGPGTIFLRNQAFLDDEPTQTWGEIQGAREDKMILSDYDEVYIKVVGDHDVKIGQELSIFRPVQSIGSYQLVEIQGTVRIDFWNQKERIARGRITESLDTIERGARLGPVTRKYEVVAPKRNEKEVRASVSTSLNRTAIYGVNQVVFIDKGEEDGLKPGNRLFVVRRGDAWHQTLASPSFATRISIESDSPAATESIPRPREEYKLPEEVIGELRVITTRARSAMVVVTSSTREIEPGDVAFARKGY